MSELKDLLLAARNVFSNCEVLGGWGTSVIWARVGNRSIRARAGNNVNAGNCTIIQDTSGQYWAFNPQPNRVASVDRSRFLAVRPRPTEEEVTYPLIFLFSVAGVTYFGGDAPRREITFPGGGTFKGIIYALDRFTIDGRLYYTALDSYTPVSGIDPDYFDFFQQFVSPIGSVWIGSRAGETTGTTSPTGEVDETTPVECYFIAENALEITSGSIHRVSENNIDPITFTVPGGILISTETVTGSISIKITVDRTETNSGSSSEYLETDSLLGTYSIQTFSSNTEYWDNFLSDLTKQRSFISHFTATYYKYDEGSGGTVVADIETLDTTEEFFLLDNGVEKACNTESVFLSDALNDTVMTALEAETIGTIDLTISVPIDTTIDPPVPDSFQPANMVGRSIVFAYIKNLSDVTDFAVRRAYGEIVSTTSTVTVNRRNYSEITVHLTLLEDVAFDSRAGGFYGTIYSDSKSVLNLFMRGINAFTFEDWVDVKTLAQRTAWRRDTTPFLENNQGGLINSGCLTWGENNTIYAPNISPYAAVLNENYVEVFTIEEEGGIIQLNRSRSPLTVAQVPYASDLLSIPFQATAIKVNL